MTDMVTAIWSEFLTIAKEEAGSRVVETWFKAVSFTEWDMSTHTVYLQAPNHFVREWIKSNYYQLLETHLKRLLHVDHIKIILTESGISESIPPQPITPTSPVIVPAKQITPKQSDETILPARSLGKSKTPSGRVYTFDSFVVGPNNSLAYAAAQAVAERPGGMYNPLFIYGGSGLGKTHLLHSIGHAVKTRDKKSVTLYQTADRFVTEFISAIRFDKIHAFQQKYKSVDVLLIDDIQFISNKEQTQEAFFHIFNTLYDAQKQIIFSSDTYPQNLQGLAERLRYRLAWGLVVDMHVPTLETRIAILKKKADLHGEPLSDEVAYFIASCPVSNIRELEGALIRVIAFASLTNQSISLEIAQKVLLRVHDTRKGPIGFERVVKCLSKYYPYSLDDLQSQNRGKELVMARQIAMFLMKKVTDKSLRDIGHYLGGRDHSTVMYALDKVQQQASSNESFFDQLKRIEDDIMQCP